MRICCDHSQRKRASLRDTMFVALAATLLASHTSAAETGDLGKGEKVFQACAACHSLAPNHNMTGPSLAGIMGRKAGTLFSFRRYSDAIKSSSVVWSDQTLDAWIANPQKFLPGTFMTFEGIGNARVRADLIAYLRQATAPGESQGRESAAGAPGDHNLKKLDPAHKVQSISYCPDAYRVMTGDGKKHVFWERNLRFQTDSSAIGPDKGSPAIFGAGMQGDRVSVIFGAPEEVSAFIQRKC